MSDYDDTSAADDPTTMWDESVLREAGLRDEPAPKETPTLPDPEDTEPSAPGPERPKARRVLKKKKRTSGPSWVATVALAIALAGFAFYVVRALR